MTTSGTRWCWLFLTSWAVVATAAHFVRSPIDPSARADARAAAVSVTARQDLSLKSSSTRAYKEGEPFVITLERGDGNNFPDPLPREDVTCEFNSGASTNCWPHASDPVVHGGGKRVTLVFRPDTTTPCPPINGPAVEIDDKKDDQAEVQRVFFGNALIDITIGIGDDFYSTDPIPVESVIDIDPCPEDDPIPCPPPPPGA